MIAGTTVNLPPSFPADRLIFATTIENGLRLVTKDRTIRDHVHPRTVTVW